MCVVERVDQLRRARQSACGASCNKSPKVRTRHVVPNPSEPPSEPGVLPSGRAVTCRGDDRERTLRIRALAIEHRRKLHHFPRPESEWKHSIEGRGAAKSSAAQRLRGRPDRDAPLLEGARQEAWAIDAVMRTKMMYRLAAPDLTDQREALIEHLASASQRWLFAKRRELRTPGRPGANAENDASAAEVVERHGCPCHVPGTPPRHGRHERSQSHPRGRRGDGAEASPCVDDRDVSLGPRDVVPEEKAVPSRFLSRGGELDQKRWVS